MGRWVGGSWCVQTYLKKKNDGNPFKEILVWTKPPLPGLTSPDPLTTSLVKNLLAPVQNIKTSSGEFSLFHWDGA